MGFRLGSFTCIYRRLHGTIRPRKGIIASPKVFNLEGTFILSGTLRSHMNHAHHHHHHHHRDLEEGGTAGERVTKLGLAADIALASGKAFAGYLSGSTAIIADAAHSVSDVVLSGVALWSFKAARVPKDKEHPYGHGKFETVGALGISLMLLATGGGIAWHAVEVLQGLLISTSHLDAHSMMDTHAIDHAHHSHHHGIDMEHPFLALNTTIISIGIKEGLYWMTKRAGEKEGSGLLKANAWHHRADAVSSVIALIGVGGAILGVPFLDPLAGFLVASMIVKAGLQNGYQSIKELVDAGAPESLLTPIRETVLKVEGVRGCHHLRGRKAGSSLHLDVHIEVDPFLSVSAAHNIGETVRRQLQEHHPEVAEAFIHRPFVSIHIYPADSQSCHVTEDRRDHLEEETEQNKLLRAATQQHEAERTVCNVLSSMFSETMKVEHVTCHFLQGKVIVQVEISMPPNMLIRDAMDSAILAENEILHAAPEISAVNIQLRLGQQIEELQSKTCAQR